MATTADSTVVAVFDNASDARSAVNDLKAAGFGSDKVFVSSEGSTGLSGYASDTSTTAHEGGITGWFKSLFGSDEHEHRTGYESAVSSGKTIVSVEASEANVDRVSDILDRYSPVDVHAGDIGAARGTATPNVYNAGYEGTRGGAATTTTGSAGVAGSAGLAGAAGRTGSTGVPTGKTNAADATGQAIPVVEEEIQVGKRAVQRGGVRVYSRVTETPVQEQVNLREEHVRVDRQPVNRPASEADFRSGTDQVIEVTEYAEEPVVAKQARVVEEVRVGKEASERTETIRDTVRRTDVEVENLTGTETTATGPTGAAGNYDADYRKHFASAYPAGSASYNDYAPAYNYGSQVANDPRFKGRSYSEVESQLREDYGRQYPNSTWEKMKDSVRYGWDKVTGKASSASAR